jgi:hypothetical protein
MFDENAHLFHSLSDPEIVQPNASILSGPIDDIERCGSGKTEFGNEWSGRFLRQSPQFSWGNEVDREAVSDRRQENSDIVPPCAFWIKSGVGNQGGFIFGILRNDVIGGVLLPIRCLVASQNPMGFIWAKSLKGFGILC